ncbi:eukaryotic translation initiation factor 4 gamma 1-like isoform X1 [Brachionus plicatilis]|uniref:Eukaryotic translation initiation factor 4 gamma 1-like isoform X1 n=1 Tax=Brachionus plicatilis TaxID=10195 RepID=A0A3M7T218_BRAPC|nr:eukaryotic translation initiation factor 4 gamma 1-like isoform X1 [Brachionus plicatilis]
MQSELILKKDVDLHHSQDPYRVQNADEIDEDQSIERQLRFVLNRLTPENFQKLVINLINLPLNTQERLNTAVNIIYQNALNEELYSHLYAQACKLMSQIKVPFEHVSSKFISFLSILLKKCEKEFDTDYHKDKYYEYLVKEAEFVTDEQKRKQLLDQANEQLEKAKQNYIGNVSFLAELYNMDLLDDAILHEGIKRLFEKQEKDEENLECLCKLLTRVGPKFDNYKNKEKIDDYFEHLRDIYEKRFSISARIRFMILNLIELRENNWTPRHESGPKRIEEIRNQVLAEREERELRFAQTVPQTQIEFMVADGRRYSLFYGYAHHILDQLKYREDFDRVLGYILKVDPDRHSELFEALICISMDKSDQQRDLIGEFFYQNLKSKVFKLDQFKMGLRKVLLKALESYMKGYKFPKKLSQILANLIRLDFLDISFLKDAFEPVKRDQLCARIMAKTLKLAAEQIGCQNVSDIFELSGLDFNYFFENFENEVDRRDFFKEMRIEWVSTIHEHQRQSVELIQSFKEKLEVIFRETGEEPLAVLDRIEPEFHKEETKTKEFIRALSVVFFEKVLHHKRIDSDKFKKMENILVNFVKEHLDLQLEMLYSVQVLAFHMKYETNFLPVSFMLLYSDEIVERKAFFKWMNNPRGKGHGIAQVFLSSFFEHISRPQTEK